MDRRRGVRRGRRRASDRATDRRDWCTFLVPAVVANAPRACIAVQNRRIASRPSLHDESAPAMRALAFPTRSQRRRSGPRLLGLRAPDLKHRSLHPKQSSATESWKGGGSKSRVFNQPESSFNSSTCDCLPIVARLFVAYLPRNPLVCAILLKRRFSRKFIAAGPGKYPEAVKIGFISNQHRVSPYRSCHESSRPWFIDPT